MKKPIMDISKIYRNNNNKQLIKKTMKKLKGFTLIELLIVIGIIGLLATLAIVSLTSAQRKARDTKRIADLKTIQTGIELYANEEAKYPVLTTASTWSNLGTVLTTLSAMPVDPQNSATSPKYYYYSAIDTGTDGNADEYVLSATLEDATQTAMDQSYNTDWGDSTNTRLVVSSKMTSGVYNVAAASYIECSDKASGIYCLHNKISD